MEELIILISTKNPLNLLDILFFLEKFSGTIVPIVKTTSYCGFIEEY